VKEANHGTAYCYPSFDQSRDRVSCDSALAQPNNIVWWEHSNPPHNNYSKELVSDWNAKNPKTPVQYEFFAMTPYFQKLTAALSTRSAADMFTVIDTLMPSYTTKNTLAPIRPEWLGYKNLDDMKTHYLPDSLEGTRIKGLRRSHDRAVFCNSHIVASISREAGLGLTKVIPARGTTSGRRQKLVRWMATR
jgi:ABC-type glycerol-3-phosphate transport system substrate-binding protein